MGKSPDFPDKIQPVFARVMEGQKDLEPGRSATARAVALARLLHEECKSLLELYVSNLFICLFIFASTRLENLRCVPVYRYI